MKEEGGKRKHLLSTTALAKLLHDWQSGGVGVDKPVPLSVCQRLAQMPCLRGPLEHLVLHTATGQKAAEMRANLRLFDPQAEAQEQKVRISLERLEARRAELAHLVDETKKAADRSAAEVAHARRAADQAAVEREVQQQRSNSLRCQAHALQALASYAAAHADTLRASTAAVAQLRPSAARPAAPAAVSELLLTYRQFLGEGQARFGPPQPPPPPPQSCLGAPALQRAAARLHGVACAEGQAVLSLLQSAAAAADGDLRTKGVRPLSGSYTAERLRDMVCEGQAQHLRMFVEEETLRTRVGDVRRRCAAVCGTILDRLDHQSTLARQLTEAQARVCGAEANLRSLERHTHEAQARAAAAAGAGAVGERGAQTAAELAALRDDRVGRCAELLGMLGDGGGGGSGGGVEESPGLSPPRKAKGLARESFAVKQAMLDACEHPAAAGDGGGGLYERLPGTGNRLLEGVLNIGAAEAAAAEGDDDPVRALEHSVLALRRAAAERGTAACAAGDLAERAAGKDAVREDVAAEVAATVECWQGCVAQFATVVRAIKDGQKLLASLDGEFAAVEGAADALRTQPASKIVEALDRARP